MRAMLSNQGTAMAETALCERDFTNETARVSAHRAALMATDAGDYTWQDVTGNDALTCQECGGYDMQTREIALIFQPSEGGSATLWSPRQLVQDGTPIDEDGEDMEYVGWRFADEEPQR